MQHLSDDNPVLLLGPRVGMLGSFFEARGMRSLVCVDVTEALAVGSHHAVDLLLTETQVDGQPLVEWMPRLRQRFPHASVLIIDEVSRSGQVVRAFNAGATGYLSTPPDETRLFDEVSRQLLAARARAGLLSQNAGPSSVELEAALGRSQKELLEAEMRFDLLQQDQTHAREAILQQMPECAAASTIAEQVVMLLEKVATSEENLSDALQQLGAAKRRIEESSSLHVEYAALLEEVELLRKAPVTLQQRLEDAEREAQQLSARCGEAQDLLHDRDEQLKQTAVHCRSLEHRVQELLDRAAEQARVLARVEVNTNVLEQRARAADIARQRAELAQREAKERAVDLELQLEEIRLKIDYHAHLASQAELKAVAAERRLKEERLRLIQEKQEAAAGSRAAILQIDKLRSELGRVTAAYHALADQQGVTVDTDAKAPPSAD